jgi:excisionase family DNA binding protein
MGQGKMLGARGGNTVTIRTPNGRDGLVLTVAELARELRIGERAAYELVWSRRIRSIRVGAKGRGIRVPRAALDEFLAGENGSQEAK